MQKSNIHGLLDKYLNKQLTGSEREELLLLLQESGQEELSQVIAGMIQNDAASPVFVSPEKSELLFRQIVEADKTLKENSAIREGSAGTKVVPMNRWNMVRRWWVAAAVLILAGTSYYLLRTEKTATPPVVAAVENDIAPGREGAILTLADGRKIVLDSLGNGVVANDNGVEVVLQDGKLAYQQTASGATEVGYNTMATPRGRQFVLVLPDGTKVWLNAASSLKYPTVFSGKERLVEITGEAYFEVAKNARQPFRVNVNNILNVEVLGTHFNINAYDIGAAVKTTLLEGSVKVELADAVSGAQKTVQLHPGQQAQYVKESNSAEAPLKVVSNVNLSKVVAWKNGFFNFEGMQLKEVLQQLELWYDIEVEYEDGIPDVEFYGELSRKNTLSEIIAALKDAEIKFKISGRKLIVLKQ